jgi:hypothetical protein
MEFRTVGAIWLVVVLGAACSGKDVSSVGTERMLFGAEVGSLNELPARREGERGNLPSVCFDVADLARFGISIPATAVSAKRSQQILIGVAAIDVELELVFKEHTYRFSPDRKSGFFGIATTSPGKIERLSVFRGRTVLNVCEPTKDLFREIMDCKFLV